MVLPYWAPMIASARRQSALPDVDPIVSTFLLARLLRCLRPRMRDDVGCERDAADGCGRCAEETRAERLREEADDCTGSDVLRNIALEDVGHRRTGEARYPEPRTPRVRAFFRIPVRREIRHRLMRELARRGEIVHRLEALDGPDDVVAALLDDGEGRHSPGAIQLLANL